jgi:transcriptional antiterminator NusG
MAGSTKDKWYALFVATGEEERVRERVEYKLKGELRAVVPRRKMRERKKGIWYEKIRTLFPGYVLLNGIMDNEKYALIRNVPGVIRLLMDKNGPLEIHEFEIRIISRLTADNEIIGISNVYFEGGRVRVIDGPLLGLEGQILSIDRRKGRVKLVLNLMGEARPVELSVIMVQLA